MATDQRNSIDTIRNRSNSQGPSDSNSKLTKYFPTPDQFIISSEGLDNDTHLPNGKEKTFPNGLEKDRQCPNEKEETDSVIVSISKDITTSIVYFGNGEVDRRQSDGHIIADEFKAYKTRFWILALFCYISFIMIIVWATFSPILNSAEYAFGWDDGYIALLEGWGSIFSIIFMIPFNWMTQKYGLRVGMLTVCSLISVATGLRCITTNEKAFTYLASAGAMVNGAGSCLLLSLPPLLSAQWFPMNERATATALCFIATQLGVAGMYFAPLMVRTPVDDVPSKDEIRSDIHVLLLIYFAMAFSALVCAIVYFPAKPPTAPSVSSSQERINYLKSIKILIRNRDVMIVSFIYTISLSVPFCWMTIMNLSLKCLDITQDESMWIAIAASVASSIATFIVARLTDRFHGHMKRSIAVLLFGSSCCFFWFLLITEGIIVTSKAQVVTSTILALSLQFSTVPLMIEFAVELAYPCPENAVGALLSFMLDTSDAAFLLLVMINSECYRWLSYALVGATSIVIIPLMFVNEVYKRSELDINLIKNPAVGNNTPDSTRSEQKRKTMDVPVLENVLSVPD